jgi:hypothetical protein
LLATRPRDALDPNEVWGGPRNGRPRRRRPGFSQRGRVAELERLAKLHTSGSLTDAEFAAEKAMLMG